MNVNKIIVAHNPDGGVNSISIMDFRHANISSIMSTKHGNLIKQLHTAIIDSDFRVDTPITVDLSDNQRFLDLSMSRLDDEIVTRHNLTNEIAALTDANLGPVTEYAMLSHYLDTSHNVPPPFKSFNSFARHLNVKGLVYLIQHVDRRDKYYVEYAMGVQYVNDKKSNIHLTLDPIEFLRLICDGRFIFCGEIYTSNCMRKLGEINNQLAITVERKITKIMQHIFDQTRDRSLDVIFL